MMIRMKAPEGKTGSVGFGGEEYFPDRSGHIMVPDRAAGELAHHGYVVVDEATFRAAAQVEPERPSENASKEPAKDAPPAAPASEQKRPTLGLKK